MHDLHRAAATGKPLLSAPPSPTRENDVHTILRANLAVADAAGLNQVTIDPRRRTPHQRRVRRCWILLVAVNVPLGTLAWKTSHPMTQASAYFFTFAVAGMALFTARPAPPSGPPFRLLHVASLNPVKDQGTLLRAVRRLVTDGLDVHLDVAGEDTMHGTLATLTRELDLAPRVTIHGFRSSPDLLPLYHAAHVFVLTSLHEAAGVVLLEAAACGVPVAGSAVGYLADWQDDRAVAVPPSDPEALARALHALLLDEPRRRALADAAGTWAVTHDADWTARAFAALYREVAALR